MWREDNIIEEIVEDSNIEDAIKTVLRKRRRKRSFAGRRILADVPKAVERIRQRIRSGRFKLGGYREMTVDDGPKVRIVQSVSLEDRIVLNAVMNVVDRHLKVRFIRTTSASIKNRGTHDLLQYIVKDIKDDPEGTLFGYQFDITKFYESVDQDVLLDAVKKMFKDKILIGILEECIRMMPKGVSIGLRSSQGLCNLLLSIYLDHRLKDQEAVHTITGIVTTVWCFPVVRNTFGRLGISFMNRPVKPAWRLKAMIPFSRSPKVSTSWDM